MSVLCHFSRESSRVTWKRAGIPKRNKLYLWCFSFLIYFVCFSSRRPAVPTCTPANRCSRYFQVQPGGQPDWNVPLRLWGCSTSSFPRDKNSFVSLKSVTEVREIWNNPTPVSPEMTACIYLVSVQYTIYLQMPTVRANVRSGLVNKQVEQGFCPVSQ